MKKLASMMVILLMGTLACNLPTAGSIQQTAEAGIAQTQLAGTIQAGEGIQPSAPAATLRPTIPFVATSTAASADRIPFRPENVLNLRSTVSVELESETPTALGWSPDSRLIAAALPSGVDVFDPLTGLPVIPRITTPEPVLDVRFTPDGNVLGMMPNSADASVRLWDLTTNASLDEWNARFEGASRVAFSPDQVTAATGYRDGTMRLWNSVEGVATLEITDTGLAAILGMDFSPDGVLIAAWGNREGVPTVVLFDVETGAIVTHFSTEDLADSPVAYPVFIPNWSSLVWVAQDSLIQINLSTGDEITRLAHQDEIISLSLTPDGRLLATSSMKSLTAAPEAVMSLWHVTTGSFIADQPNFSDPPLVAFSPDGTLLVTASDGELKTWMVRP